MPIWPTIKNSPQITRIKHELDYELLKILLIISAILKFAVSEKSKKFRRKMFFSGISEATQANFNGP